MALVGARDAGAHGPPAAHPAAARRPLPRRRRGAADAEGVRTREGPGRGHPRDHRTLPPRGDGDAAGHVPVVADPRAGRDDLGGARGGRDRAAADGRAASTCAPRCSRSCSRPRPTCRCASSAPTTTPAPRAWPPPSRCSRCSRRPCHARGTRRTSPIRRAPGSPSRGCAVSYPGRSEPALDDVSLTVRAGRGARARRPERLRQVDAARRPAGAGHARARGACASATSTSPSSTSRPGASALAWVPQRPHLFAASIAENVRLGRRDASTEEVWAAIAAAGLRRRRAQAARGPRHACSASAAPGCRRASASGSRSRARSCATRRCCCSTSRPPTSTARPSAGSMRDDRAARPRGARWCSSPTARRCSRSPTGSSRSAQRSRSRRERLARRRRRPQAPLLRTLALARPAAGRLALATLLGAGAMAAAIGLIATSAWLISRSSQRPQESAVAVAIVGVQFFALSRGLCRYGERLVGHDAAFRVLADAAGRACTSASSGSRRWACRRFAAATCSRAWSATSTRCRTCCCGCCRRSRSRSIVGCGDGRRCVWWMLPAAGLILLAALLSPGSLVPWLTGRARRARGGAAGGGPRGADRRRWSTCSRAPPSWPSTAPPAEQLGARPGRRRRADAARRARAPAPPASARGWRACCSGLAMWGALRRRRRARSPPGA